jgi:hypothetical protein
LLLCHENEKLELGVVQQSLVSILIITPIIIFFLTLIPLIVKIIFTPESTLLFQWFVLDIGCLEQFHGQWAVLIAKGDSKIIGGLLLDLIL